MKVGDKVLYLGTFTATVRRIANNGITIEFWRDRFGEAQLVTRRVSRNDIKTI